MLDITKLKEFARHSQLQRVRLLKDQNVFDCDYATILKKILATQYPKNHLIGFGSPTINPLKIDPFPDPNTDAWFEAGFVLGVCVLNDQLFIVTSGILNNWFGKLEYFPYPIYERTYKEMIKRLIEREIVVLYNFDTMTQVTCNYESMAFGDAIQNYHYEEFRQMVLSDGETGISYGMLG